MAGFFLGKKVFFFQRIFLKKNILKYFFYIKINIYLCCSIMLIEKWDAIVI